MIRCVHTDAVCAPAVLAVATAVATAFLSVGPARAQTAAPPAPPAAEAPAGQGTRQTVTLQATVRRVTVGGGEIAEEAAPISYRVVHGPATFRFNVTPVSYAASGTTIHGSTPLGFRLDYEVRKDTTLRVYGHTASIPATLTDAETSALGEAGTPTLDLDSFSLGTPGLAGVRLTQTLGSGSIRAGVSGTYEYQPRPGGSEPAYWRGQTAGGGASLLGAAGANQFTLTFDATRSSADDLDGRNLFPGGGTISLSGSAVGPFGDDSLTTWQVFGFYFRPINSSRPDQPNRLIPIGDFMGLNTSVTFPVGDFLLWPSVDLSREASHTTTQNGLVEERIEGSGWTTNFSLAVTIPAGAAGDLTVTGGAIVGAVSAAYTSRLGAFVTSDTFRDPIRGRWLSLEWSRRF